MSQEINPIGSKCDAIAAIETPPKSEVEQIVDSVETPHDLSEVVCLLSAASKLVETAAYGAARSTDAQIVTDLLLISARLDAKTQTLRKTL